MTSTFLLRAYLGFLGAAGHGKALGLGQNDVILEHRVDVGGNILMGAPSGRPVLLIVAIFFGVFAVQVYRQAEQRTAGCPNQQIQRVQTGPGGFPGPAGACQTDAEFSLTYPSRWPSAMPRPGWSPPGPPQNRAGSAKSAFSDSVASTFGLPPVGLVAGHLLHQGFEVRQLFQHRRPGSLAHPFGSVFLKCGGHGIRVPRLEKHQVFGRI